MKRLFTICLLVIFSMSLYAQDDKPQISIKTNVVGWAMGVTNAAVEIDLAENWSVSIPVYYSGFNYFSETLKFKVLTLQPEVRYHFPSVSGLFIGTHIGIGVYNIAYGDWRIQSAGKRPAYGGGLGIGYKLPFKKNPQWAVEFALGAGIYDTMYDRYYNEVNGPLAQAGVRKTFVGIDNASVSFTYSFNMK